MKLERISNSSYSTYSECQLKYFLDEILKYRMPSGLAADKGSCVHKVLEILARVKKTHQNDGEYFEDKTFGKITTDLENIDVDGLINKVYNYYSSTTDHNWAKKDYKDVYNWTYVIINDDTFNPLKQTILDAERYFKIELESEYFTLPNGEQLKISGIIDLVVELGENQVEIIDYKTGRRQDWITGETKDHDKLKNDLQLMMYYMAAKHLYGDKHVMVTIYYIKDGGPFTVALDDGCINKTKNILYKRMKEISSNDSPKRNRSWKCKKFCGFSKMSFNEINDNITPKQQFMSDGLSEKGSPICMCDEATWKIPLLGIDEFIKQYKKPQQ